MNHSFARVACTFLPTLSLPIALSIAFPISHPTFVLANHVSVPGIDARVSPTSLIAAPKFHFRAFVAADTDHSAIFFAVADIHHFVYVPTLPMITFAVPSHPIVLAIF